MASMVAFGVGREFVLRSGLPRAARRRRHQLGLPPRRRRDALPPHPPAAARLRSRPAGGARAWLRRNKANASATEECTLEEACALTATLKRLHGPRVVLPPDLEKAWPALFGEEFKDRHNHVPIIVLLHCFSSERREAQLRKYLTPHYLGKHRHVFASDRTDVSRGILLRVPRRPGPRRRRLQKMEPSISRRP